MPFTPRPRAVVVIEDRYPEIFTRDHVRPVVVADRLAKLQIALLEARIAMSRQYPQVRPHGAHVRQAIWCSRKLSRATESKERGLRAPLPRQPIA